MKENKKPFFFARVFADTNLYKVYISEKQIFRYGAEVVIKTEFGQDLAVITSLKTDNEDSKEKFFDSGSLIRYATEEDKVQRKNLDKKIVELKAEINTLVDYLKLEMNITHVLIPLSDNSICIYYTARGRVDFRDLLTELRNKYKIKITMRQIGPKDRSSSFLSASDLFLYNRQLR